MGTVTFNTSNISFKDVGLKSGDNVIGNVGLESGANSVGDVGLNAGTNEVGKTRLIDSNSREAEIDATGYLVQIPIEHHKVHDGVMYGFVDKAVDIQSNAPKYWMMRAPNTSTQIHMVIAVTADNASTIELFENPTLTGDGSELTAYNFNRNSNNTATLKAYKDATTSNDGTLLAGIILGANTNKTKVGGAARQNTEYILKQNEEYIIKATVVNNDTDAVLLAEFYEV